MRSKSSFRDTASKVLGAKGDFLTCSAAATWCPDGFVYDPTYVLAGSPLPAGACVNHICGNGVLDAGEDCDWDYNQSNLTIWRDNLQCSNYPPNTRGALLCNAQGTEHQCTADTSGCGVCSGMFCGNAQMKCNLPVIMNQGTPDEFVVKASGAAPGSPTYELADNWTACNDNFTDARRAGLPVPIPTQTCNTLWDCVYANEADQPNPGANPTCYDYRNNVSPRRTPSAVEA